MRRRGMYVGLKRRFEVDPMDLNEVDPSMLAVGLLGVSRLTFRNLYSQDRLDASIT